MGLKDIIIKDGGLKERKDDRMKFMTFASLFDSDLEANLHRTSIELNQHYKTEDVSGWRDFLKHPSVKKYIKDFLDEIAEKNADKRLAEDVDKAADALKVKAVIDAKKPDNENHRYIMWFVPQKDYINDK